MPLDPPHGERGHQIASPADIEWYIRNLELAHIAMTKKIEEMEGPAWSPVLPVNVFMGNASHPVYPGEGTETLFVSGQTYPTGSCINAAHCDHIKVPLHADGRCDACALELTR
jgi:hypothetical protein